MNLLVIFEWFLTFWAPGDEKFSFFPNIPKQAFLYTCINKFPWEFEKKNWLFFSFTAHRNMRTIPNAFLANMSLADLLLASLNCSFNFVTMRDRKWVFGSTYCKLNNFMAIVTVAASVLNLTAMSLDR